MFRFATLVCALVVSGAVAASGSHTATPRVPDFSGRWRIALENRPITGGPTTALFGLKLRPPEQVDTPPLTRTGERPANGSVSFQGVIGADGRIADLEPLAASVWSGFLPDLVRSMTESQRRQQFRAARVDNVPVATLLNSVLQTTERPEGVTAQVVPLPHDLTIEQTGTGLTIRRTTPVGVEIVVYPLDGTSTKTRLMLAAPTAVEWEHTTRWDGDKLVTTTVAGGSAAVMRTETRALDGGRMVVETSWPQPNGVPPIVKKLVYAKVN